MICLFLLEFNTSFNLFFGHTPAVSPPNKYSSTSYRLLSHLNQRWGTNDFLTHCLRTIISGIFCRPWWRSNPELQDLQSDVILIDLARPAIHHGDESFLLYNDSEKGIHVVIFFAVKICNFSVLHFHWCYIQVLCKVFHQTYSVHDL